MVQHSHIEVEGIAAELVRKRVKRLNITVYPPDGRVMVSAPHRMAMGDICRAIAKRADWIRKHQQAFAGKPRFVAPRFETGESHYFLGQPYTLAVTRQDGRPAIAMRENVLAVNMREGEGSNSCESLLYAWYRQQMKELVPGLLGTWEQVVGVRAGDWGIRRMRTKWGTCNIKTGKIWLNLELIKRPVHCLEYVIVHELVHLLEPSHNKRFAGFMDRFMPRWQKVRHELREWDMGG